MKFYLFCNKLHTEDQWKRRRPESFQTVLGVDNSQSRPHKPKLKFQKILKFQEKVF